MLSPEPFAPLAAASSWLRAGVAGSPFLSAAGGETLASCP